MSADAGDAAVHEDASVDGPVATDGLVEGLVDGSIDGAIEASSEAGGDAAPDGSADAAHGGLTLAAGAVVCSSSSYKLIATLGQGPGDNNSATSANYRLVGGLVGATQAP